VSAKRTPLSLDRPSANLSADADAWVGGAVAAVGERGGPPVTATKPSSAVQVEVRELIKRLTIDIPESLCRAMKVQTAERGMKMVDEVRALLEAHYRGMTLRWGRPRPDNVFGRVAWPPLMLWAGSVVSPVGSVLVRHVHIIGCESGTPGRNPRARAPRRSTIVSCRAATSHSTAPDATSARAPAQHTTALPGHG